MTRQVAGVLTTGAGVPIPNLPLKLTSLANTPTTIPALHELTFSTDGDGAYSVTLQEGVYRVEAFYSHGRAVLGEITVSSGPSIDLITLLGAEAVDPGLAQQLLDQVAALASRVTALETGGEPEGLSYEAGEALGGHRAVYRAADGLLYYASQDAPQNAHLTLGLTTGSASLGAAATVRTRGPITEAAWSWALNNPVWLGLNGQITQTPPTSGAYQILGWPLSATTLFVDVQSHIERASA